MAKAIDYVSLASNAVEVMGEYLKSPDSEWKVEKGESLEEGIVHSRKVKGAGKVFRMKTYLDYPPQQLYDFLVSKVEAQQEWNSTVKECKVLQVVDDHTDVVYMISHGLAGGAISSRDFVNLRTWVIKDGVPMVAGLGVEHPDMPPQKAHVRADNGIGGYVFEPHPSDTEKTLFYWISNTDIKGWFPKVLVDTGMANVLFDFRRDLVKQIQVMKSKSPGGDNQAEPSENQS